MDGLVYMSILWYHAKYLPLPKMLAYRAEGDIYRYQLDFAMFSELGRFCLSQFSLALPPVCVRQPSIDSSQGVLEVLI